MNKMNKHELFNKINEFSFMLDDLTLYLNTHPKCDDAIDAYNHYKHLRNKLIAEYTMQYGPISKYDVNVDNYWVWINQPWPWEGACNN